MKAKLLKIIGFALLGISFLVLIISCSSMQSILGWPSYDSKEAEISRLLSNVRPHHGNPDAHYLLACYYQERGKHKEAFEEFKKVLSIDPNYAKAYNGMGVSYDLLGDFSKATEYYNYALKLNPTADYVYNNLGYSYLLQGNVDEAIIALKKASDLNNKDKTFHNNLGLAYGEKGQYDFALAEFKLASDEPKAHFNMAQIYFKKGLMDEAKNHYAIALKLNPSQTVAHTALKATDALVKIFEPTSGKVEPKQLVVPDPPKVIADVENLKAPEQLTTVEKGAVKGEPLTVSDQQTLLKEVSLSYDISKEDKKPTIAVEKTKNVAETKEMRNEAAVNVKPMEAPPVTHANFSTPEKANLPNPQPQDAGLPKVRPEPPIATLPSTVPSGAGPGAVEPVKKPKEIVDVSLEDKKDFITYSIVADGTIGDYDVFKLGFPSRLVLDIWDMGDHYPRTGIWLDNLFIKVVRIGHYPDKMRFVFDSLNPRLPPYQVDRMDDKLMVSFGNIPQPDEPKVHARATSSPEKDAPSASTKTPVEASRNGKLAIEISNGNGVNKMARMVGDYLERKGFKVTRLTNADYFNYAETKIFYQKEYRNAADQVGEQLPVFRSKEETEKFGRPNIKMKILIGKDLVPHKKSFENGNKS